MRHRWELQLRTQDDTALSTRGLISVDQWSLGTHQLS